MFFLSNLGALFARTYSDLRKIKIMAGNLNTEVFDWLEFYEILWDWIVAENLFNKCDECIPCHTTSILNFHQKWSRSFLPSKSWIKQQKCGVKNWHSLKFMYCFWWCILLSEVLVLSLSFSGRNRYFHKQTFGTQSFE